MAHYRPSCQNSKTRPASSRHIERHTSCRGSERAAPLYNIVHSQSQVLRVLRRFMTRPCGLWRPPATRSPERTCDTAPQARNRGGESARRSRGFDPFWRSGDDLWRKIWDFDALGFIVIACGDDLAGSVLGMRSFPRRIRTSMISSRGNERKGMSAALQAIR